MGKIKLTGPEQPIDVSLTIGGSKSISNRALIIRALSGKQFNIHNLSDSDDTLVLDQLLSKHESYFDCGHAGTSFRFLTAYLAIRDGEQILTGSERMLQRPIGPLVEALNHIGANIDFQGERGFPPLKIGSFNRQKENTVTIDAGISSQFVSALCLIAPLLPKGLKIRLEGKQVSSSYLQMTLAMMAYFGVGYTFRDNEIIIDHQLYTSRDFLVESDWSSAGYLFAIAALSPNARIRARYFFEDSLQGDSAVQQLMRPFGVLSKIEGDELILEQKGDRERYIKHDFISQPDLYQTMAVVAAALNIELEASGLQTLEIKETDRLFALSQELSKIGVGINKVAHQQDDINYHLKGKCKIEIPEFEDYGDHRMVMSLACLATISPVIINNPGVVSKSYPDFWKDLETMGFKITSV